tara:strand:+ start:2621 stop:2848 length:228 start_codon:yes stop_codon:yes gene_type:complete
MERPSELKATFPDNSALTGVEIAKIGARKSSAHKRCVSGGRSMDSGEQPRHFKPAYETVEYPSARDGGAGPIGKP